MRQATIVMRAVDWWAEAEKKARVQEHRAMDSSWSAHTTVRGAHKTNEIERVLQWITAKGRAELVNYTLCGNCNDTSLLTPEYRGDLLEFGCDDKKRYRA